MKYISLITTLLLTFAGRGQSRLQVDTIPQSVSVFETAPGFVLNTGWHWKAGDDAGWAATDYNDSAWHSVNPLLDVHHSQPGLPKTGVFWLRLRFAIDSNIQKNQLALLIQQSGASEIYYNGKLLKQFGSIDDGKHPTIAYDPKFDPILLPVNQEKTQTLALRYALQQNVLYSTAFGTTSNPLLIAKLQYAKTAIDSYHQAEMLLSGYHFFVLGLFFLLALIHIGYYFFSKSQKANLYLALYALCYMGYILSPILIDTHAVFSKYFASTASFFFVDIVGPLLLSAIYILLGFKRDWVYYAALAVFILSIGVYFWQYQWGWRVGTDLMSMLVQFAIIRIVIRAVRQKKKGAWLLAVGAVLFLLTFAVFIAGPLLFPANLVLINVLFVVAVLCIPLATSLYLGLEFGFVSVSLQEKLNEVSLLSEKNIAQEKEKQQLLTSQNETLEMQVKERTAALSQSLDNLKAAQSQLVHAEKMASLGELTAGIAHEIQNPLNFVNNFSEVSVELIDEMEEAMEKNDGATAKEIANDIRENLKKIESHGKRADGIVKGMLQHSRTAGSAKESTDINKLIDEYLRLSYHGLRAKDKDFSANYETSLPGDLPMIKVVPQEIGRVLLNLFNNAFYSVNQKRKIAGGDYKPLVSISTAYEERMCCIRVSDNGMGVPAAIRDKIFQPFFTTKPTGQGTGLGLSISYDIIKAHGGSFELQGEEGEFAEFIIKLPVEPRRSETK